MYKVLIAEDEDIIRRGLAVTVPWEKFGCTVAAECINGEEGIRAIRECRPDIVLTDINMPVVNGLEMIRRTCEEYEYSAIILSGYSEFEYAQTAIRYGVLGYLLKPLKQSELSETVEKAVRECERRERYRRSPAPQTALLESFLQEFPAEPDSSDQIVAQMLRFVRDNYSRKIRMKDLERALHYSDTFLNKKFKETMGTTFMEYVNRYRIRCSLRMMLEERMSVQEAAWRCGIGEYKYFRSVFKKYLGCSPREFLENL